MTPCEMRPPMPRLASLWNAFASAALLGASFVSAVEERVDFNRDIRPIISDKCFHCHGPDADNQKSDFRLDTRENAIADLGGVFGIVPGNLEESDLHWRIWEDFEEDLMPPIRSKLSLSDEEKKMLDRWIEQGAPYDTHWSFKPIESPELPTLSSQNKAWAANEIDHFVAARLEQEGLAPSKIANKETLIRRATLDLTGLPPTIEEVDSFLADEGPGAWERVVDRLLRSPRYGERMALVWLDAARYADSGGYQNDILRSQWPWRDWVIDAYNANMPFDQFTLEQLAGDLLDAPTESQILATAFNRNHRINNEGGIIPEEYLAEYVADRVETTSTVWLGLTMGCARCHDHKYDPLSQKDFYRMFAFFNNIPEKGKDGNIAPQPNMAVYHGAAQSEHDALKERVAAVTAETNALRSQSEGEFAVWLQGERADQKERLKALEEIGPAAIHVPFDSQDKSAAPDLRKPGRKADLNDRSKRYKFLADSKYGKGLKINLSTYGRILRPHGGEFRSDQARSWIVNLRTPRSFAGSEGPILSLVEPDSVYGYRLMLEETGDSDAFRVSFQMINDGGEKSGIEVVSGTVVPKNDWVRLGVTWDGSGNAAGIRLYMDGRILDIDTLLDNLGDTIRSSVGLIVGVRNVKDAEEQLRDATLRNGIIDDLQVFDKELGPTEVALISQTDPLYASLIELNESARDSLMGIWLENTPQAKSLAKRQKDREAELAAFEREHVIRVSIMEEMDTPRDTYLLSRGAYDQPDMSETLDPDVPGALPAMDDNYPKNRLGLAQWIVSPSNPLTARVAVNRYWQMYFGNGLVKTPEDFGSQGANPSHPQLLDWLASAFQESGWDVKGMQKRILMSATYRQSSRVTPDALEVDPENRLLARGPRIRLYGHALRDQALAVSGLMAERRGGPSVMPYQPEGLWEEVSAKGYKYVVGSGSDLYRRSLYTFWRRTVPPPSMMNFDSSAREVCSVSFNATNTPLQALNLMNDPQFIEAARMLGQRMILEGGDSPMDRIRFGHRLVLARSPGKETLDRLESSYSEYLEYYRKASQDAVDLISMGASNPDPEIEPSELAAMTMIANVFLNLDETVTKQ